MEARDRVPATGRRSVAVIGAAVVVVLLVAGALAAVQARGDGGHRAGPADVSGLPAPDPGQQWISWHGVAAQVPASWAYGHEPDDQWCAGHRDSGPPGPAPYVSLDPAFGFHTAVGCPTGGHHDPVFGPAPESLWADHVTLESPQGADGTWQDDGWTLTTRTVARVQVRVLSRDPTEARAILASAQVITVDASGCASSSPIQDLGHVRPDPFEVTSVDSVDAVSVCQYDRSVPASEPGLMASSLMTGSAAADYLQALRAAPTGGGPDDPGECVTGPQTDGTGTVVRLWSGSTSHDLFAYYDWCRDNGIDDGTTRRALTHGTCPPLFATPPVMLWQSQADVLGVCTAP